MMYLTYNLTGHYSNEYPVRVNVLKYVLFPVYLTSIELVENLHEHERVKYHRIVFGRWGKIIVTCVTRIVKAKEPRAREQEDIEYYELICRMPENEQPHSTGYQGFLAPVGFPLQELVGGRFGGESKTSKSIHDEINPEELDGTEGRVPNTEWPDENQSDGNNVYRQLELEEFWDGVVDVATPLDSFHDTREVIIC